MSRPPKNATKRDKNVNKIKLRKTLSYPRKTLFFRGIVFLMNTFHQMVPFVVRLVTQYSHVRQTAPNNYCIAGKKTKTRNIDH